MNLIDVHIARRPNENPEWWKQCQDSLQQQPINVHMVDAVEGDVRAARYNGFSQGTAPYVSFVDPDDYVLPDTFTKCLETIQNSPDNVCGVYTMSNRLKVKNNRIKLLLRYRPWTISSMKWASTVHQIVVYKRKLLTDVFMENYDSIHPFILPEYKLHCFLSVKYDWIAINHVGYVWRDHSSGIHNATGKYNNLKQSRQVQKECKQLVAQAIKAREVS